MFSVLMPTNIYDKGEDPNSEGCTEHPIDIQYMCWKKIDDKSIFHLGLKYSVFPVEPVILLELISLVMWFEGENYS